jgi:tripartite-type tricarboxylate transporter receptor subunit TctC
MRALAISSKGRHSGAPDVPTFAEAGLPEFSASAWFGLLAPAATPREVIHQVQAEAARILLSPEAKARLAAIGFDAVAGSPEAFADLIAAESARWGNLIKAAGIRVE